ncbi:Inorganic phosphate transporter 1-2 [Purpureocillium lavendulum]|uniref:Inorganic phosphate transporter 1-2 n=1 Tax=Purpureocillium lavendulum TaxID=1247861 RepID=A0AB34G3K1_9HYPO|nr:Inorganic phosphate transporter 1-2 [Purpureocillium lavendulum]
MAPPDGGDHTGACDPRTMATTTTLDGDDGDPAGPASCMVHRSRGMRRRALHDLVAQALDERTGAGGLA